MKTFQLIIVSFLLIVITKTYDVVGQYEQYIVYDGEGDQIKPNVLYYISFMTSDYNMWICRLPTSCQQPVMVTHPDPTLPTPVMFETVNKTETVIREWSDVKVKFVNSSPCGGSAYWRVPGEESEVVLGGSNLGIDTTFMIMRTDQYYKFLYVNGEYKSVIGLTNGYPLSKLKSSRLIGEMEVYFYKNMSTLS